MSLIVTDDAVEAFAVSLWGPGWDRAMADLVRAAMEAALPALRSRRVELGAVFGYELGWNDCAEEIARAQEKRDPAEWALAGRNAGNDAARMAREIGGDEPVDEDMAPEQFDQRLAEGTPVEALVQLTRSNPDEPTS
jgi:hypothetical protein